MTKFLLLTILLFTGISSFAQTQTEKEVLELLSHKWKVTDVELNGEKQPAHSEFGDVFLELKADGSFIANDPGKKEQKGKWSYDHKGKTLIIIGEEKQKKKKHELIKISDSDLIIKMGEDGIILTLILKRAD